MTKKQQIISFLQNHSQGIDDDELAKELDLSARQQANIICRQLEKEGLVIRRRVDGKIQNFWVSNKTSTILSEPINTKKNTNKRPKTENWYWEGNVQSTVITFLATDGYQIRSVADTASHQQGKDIEAEKDGNMLWVSVKGYPQSTERTNHSIQAGHWFKQAIFDIIEYREENKNIHLAVALTDFSRYRSMAQKITWLQPAAKFSYFWVQETGKVHIG